MFAFDFCKIASDIDVTIAMLFIVIIILILWTKKSLKTELVTLVTLNIQDTSIQLILYSQFLPSSLSFTAHWCSAE